MTRVLHCTTPPQLFYGPFFLDHPSEPVPEENLWTLWCKGRLTEADTETMGLGATPSGLTSAHLHHPPRVLHCSTVINTRARVLNTEAK